MDKIKYSQEKMEEEIRVLKSQWVAGKIIEEARQAMQKNIWKRMTPEKQAEMEGKAFLDACNI